jgi:hypothetical protein
MTITAGVASVQGTYLGDVELADPLPPESFTLRASGWGAPGTVRAQIKITLTGADDGTTTVSYDADTLLDGPVGALAQQVITAAAKQTATQFFAAVDAALASVSPRALTEPPGESATSGAPPSPPVRMVPSAATIPGPAARDQRSSPIDSTSQDYSAATRGRPAGGPLSRLGQESVWVLVGAAVALAGVLLGWFLGRRSR